MNHPPIPPNLDFFGVLDESYGELAGRAVYLPALGGYQLLDDLHGTAMRRMRKVVSDQARCAWLDEADKRNHEWARQYEGENEAAEHDAFQIVNQAIENAEEWRVWGIA